MRSTNNINPQFEERVQRAVNLFRRLAEKERDPEYKEKYTEFVARWSDQEQRKAEKVLTGRANMDRKRN